MNSTANIHRRFSLLFTLPSTSTTIALLLAVSSPIILLPSIISKVGAYLTSIYFIMFEAALLLSILVEYTVLRRNPLATFRRLAFISVVSNGIWLMLVAIASLASPERLFSFIILGGFFSLTLKFLVFGSVFFRRLSTAFSVSILQPALLTTTLIFSHSSLTYGAWKPVLLFSGATLVVAVAVYLAVINSSGFAVLKVPALTMLQAFLKAWSVEDPSSLEDIVEMSSSKTTVRTSILTFDAGVAKPMLIVPEVHPGPFYPIGSSNLPYQLYKHFSDRGFSPLVLHGISGHELNLVSKKEVDNLFKSYEHMKSLEVGETCTRLLTVKWGQVVANGVAFRDYAVILLTLAPEGMEDFPREIKKPLEYESMKNGFTHLFLVDTHNSQGSYVEEEQTVELIEATKKMLKELRRAEQYVFRTGFAHSSELDISFAKDVGPAGIGVLMLEVCGEKYVLVAVDANNARRGLREQIINHLTASNLSVIEICTSDTHITAGKVMTTHGYIALGDETPTEYIVDAVKKICDKAASRLSTSKFDVRYTDTEVRVVGTAMLDDVSKALDRVITIAKRGGVSLAALSLLILVSSVLF